MKKYIAEIIGTFWLVFASLGAAHFAAGVEDVGLIVHDLIQKIISKKAPFVRKVPF